MIKCNIQLINIKEVRGIMQIYKNFFQKKKKKKSQRVALVT